MRDKEHVLHDSNMCISLPISKVSNAEQQYLVLTGAMPDSGRWY